MDAANPTLRSWVSISFPLPEPRAALALLHSRNPVKTTIPYCLKIECNSNNNTSLPLVTQGGGDEASVTIR